MSGGHTPGPWECQTTNREGPDFGVSIVGANLGGLVGYALPWPTELDSGDYTRVEANARLIAAAPDGLELAQDAIPTLEVLLEEREEQIGEECEILRDLLARTRAFVLKSQGAA